MFTVRWSMLERLQTVLTWGDSRWGFSSRQGWAVQALTISIQQLLRNTPLQVFHYMLRKPSRLQISIPAKRRVGYSSSANWRHTRELKVPLQSLSFMKINEWMAALVTNHWGGFLISVCWSAFTQTNKLWCVCLFGFVRFDWRESCHFLWCTAAFWQWGRPNTGFHDARYVILA